MYYSRLFLQSTIVLFLDCLKSPSILIKEEVVSEEDLLSFSRNKDKV